MNDNDAISAADWAKGILLSVLASIIGGVSKLALRKSWLLQHAHEENSQHSHDDDVVGVGVVNGDVHHSQQQRRDDHPNAAAAAALPAAAASPTDISDRPSLDPPTMTAAAAAAAAAATTTTNGDDNPLQETLLDSTHHQTYCCCGPSRRTSRDDEDDSQSPLNHLHHRTHPNLVVARCIRYSGMVGMSILNPVCCVLAMNYASPSILAPFSGLTLVWVILGSPLVTQETPSHSQMVACALIIVGEVIVAIFGDHTNDEGVTVDDVRESYLKPGLWCYFAGLVLYEAVLWYWIAYSTSPLLRRFAWGSAGGTLTGMQNFLKDSLTILKAVQQSTSSHDENGGSNLAMSLPWFLYLFIALAAATAFLGLLVLTASMKRYDATYGAASFVGSFVVSASIMATVHYNTFAELPGLVNYILYPLGLVVLMIGVYFLVRDSASDSSQGDGLFVSGDDDDINVDPNDVDDNTRGRTESKEDDEVRHMSRSYLV